MNEVTKRKLLAINEAFYTRFADSFAQTRTRPQPGFKQLLPLLPSPVESVLDVGCGNGRFGLFLRNHLLNFVYTGVDFSFNLLQKAEEELPGTFFHRDISRPGFLKGIGNHDLIVCLATMQHIPGFENRCILLKEMGEHLTAGGFVILANWQFLDSPRQRRKIQDWGIVDVEDEDVESGDYLLNWQKDQNALRYVCMIDVRETAELADKAGLVIRQQFRSDGREGNLNLYTVLSAPTKGL